MYSDTCTDYLVLCVNLLLTMSVLCVCILSLCVEEIVQKMSLILEGLNTPAKADYRTRKGSKN